MGNKIAAAAGPAGFVTLVLSGHMHQLQSRVGPPGMAGGGPLAHAEEGMQLILVALLKPLLFAMVAIASSKSMQVVREQTNLSWNCQQCSFLALQIPAGPGLNPEVLQTAEI